MTQVRQAPQTVQNVVTYDVVVSVDNPELLLKPGMTATVRIITAQRENVLRVPDQALRYVPGGARRHGAAAKPVAAHVWAAARRETDSRLPWYGWARRRQLHRDLSGDLKAGDRSSSPSRAAPAAQQDRRAASALSRLRRTQSQAEHADPSSDSRA